MPNRVRVLTLPDRDRAELERRVRDRGAPARVAERARIVLLSAAGLTGPQIAVRAGCTEPTTVKWRRHLTVVKWRRQYAEDGLAGLEDAHRPGGPKTVLTDAAVCEILSATVIPAAGLAAGAGDDALVQPTAPPLGLDRTGRQRGNDCGQHRKYRVSRDSAVIFQPPEPPLDGGDPALLVGRHPE
jgi:transposase-like protein